MSTTSLRARRFELSLAGMVSSLVFVGCVDDSSSLQQASWCYGEECSKPDAAVCDAPVATPDASVPDAGEAGCARTFGYWKNHNQFETNRNQRIDWPSPIDEQDLLCGQGLLDILHTPPTKGNAWYILAHQYIAAILNQAAGAQPTPDATIDASLDWLAANCGYVHADDAPDAIEWADILDAFNNGNLEGYPAHCE